MLPIKALIAAACTLFITVAFATAAGTADRTPQPSDPATGSADDADGLPDPRHLAAEDAWKRYQHSLFETLSHSPQARDWALATLLDRSTPAESVRAELLRRAVQAAPHDVLVQVVMAQQSQSATADAVAIAVAAQTLQNIEPDNAASWLAGVRTAELSKNQDAIDKALSKLAASRHFDSHFADFIKAMSDVYRRNPVPDEYWSLAVKEDKAFPREAAPFVYALSVSATVGLPAYHHLVSVCHVNPTSTENASRVNSCAAIGRMMVEHGDTLITNRIGHTLLRMSRTFTDADLAAVRNFDWIYSNQARKLADDQTPESILAYENDWTESGSETEAMRRKLVRAGIPTSAPDSWIDEGSPFSAERMRKDETWFAGNYPPTN